MKKQDIICYTRSQRILVGIVFLLSSMHVSSFQSSSWKHLRSEHFVISYDERTVSVAPKALKIAEETRDILCSYFGELPLEEKIVIVLSDSSDEPNGTTAERVGLIRVDCRKTQGLFRGETDWLRTVLTHELSHAYTLALLRSPLWVKTWVSFGSSLYTGTLWGSNSIPLWFLEGLAQMGSERVAADYRDTIREMILRDAARTGRLLSLSEMARFEGTSLDMELVYNQGYSFLHFLEKKYENVPLQGLCAQIRKKGFAPSFYTRYGKTIESLYGEWISDLCSEILETDTKWPAGERIFANEAPLVLETTCASEGTYVIANWGNDYARFGLFEKEPNGKYSCIADYTGTAVKKDRKTGEIWFTKRTYNYEIGVENYDLFKKDIKGGPIRITTGARSLAFDAVDGHLIFAKYEKGCTHLVSRRPDGTESILAELPTGITIYSISVINQDTAILSVGTGKKTQGALLSAGAIHYLWKDIEVMDAVFAGDQRFFFCSTVSGTPQIYWADMQHPRRWYQVTNVPGGARFPTIETGATGTKLYYSRFENGGYRLYVIADPFLKNHQREIEGPLVAEATMSVLQENVPAVIQTLFNPVFASRPLSLGIYSTASSQNASGLKSGLMGVAAVGLGGSLFDAPGDSELAFSLDVHVPLKSDQFVFPWISARVNGSFDLGSTRNMLQYEFETISQTIDEIGIITNASHNAFAITEFQISVNQTVGASASFGSYFDTTSKSMNEFFRVFGGGIKWQIADSPRSLFDQARLGGDWYHGYFGVNIKYPILPNTNYYSSSVYQKDSHPICMLQGEASFHALLAGGKMGMGGSLSGYSFFGGVSGSSYTPNVLPTIGGTSAFIGYPDEYALVNDLAAASFELAVNPFVNRRARTSDIQRLSVSVKLEGGVARYFNQGLSLGAPLSISASFKRHYYARPNQESLWYLTGAIPLIDFTNTLPDITARVYAGISY